MNATSTLSAENDGGTTLFSSLSSSLQDVAPDRVGAAIFITDGQVHDIPESADKLGLSAPLHAIITGSETDKDRRIVLRKAPRFGIVGESQEIVYSVIEEGFETDDPVEVRVFSDGELITVEDAFPGEDVPFVFDIPHGGKNIIEFHVAPIEGEITDVNNRTFATIEGIRENLRVLLVSGEPHAGERTWRNLLNSDGSVDLVHFTILRELS